MQDLEDVAIFWDFEGTRTASNISGYDIAKNIRLTGQIFGTVKSFRSYYDFSALTSLRNPNLRHELQSSGISLIDCPSAGGKNIATKMMMVDLIIHALDHPAPTTFLIITADRDFGYAIATLRLRKYRVVLLSPPGTHPDVTSQASVNIDWNKAVLELGDEIDTTFNPDAQPSAVHTPHSQSQASAPPPVPDHQDIPVEPININRSRRDSVFSRPFVDPDRFNIFGDPYNPPKLPTFSDTFLRPQWPLRADSAPPMETSYAKERTSTPEPTGFYRPSDGVGYARSADKGKGKQRAFPFPEPEDPVPFSQSPTPPFRRSSLNHSDTDMAGREQINPLRHSPLTSVQEPPQNQGQFHRSPPSVESLSSSSSESSSGFSMVGPSTAPTSAESAAREKENATRVAPTDAPSARSASIVSVQDSLPQAATVPVPSTATTVVDRAATPAAVATTVTPSAVPTFVTPAASTPSAAAAPNIASSTTAAPAASPHIPGKPAIVRSASQPLSSPLKVSASTPSAGPSTTPFAGSSTTPFAGPSKNAQPKPRVPEKFRILVERIRQYPNHEATRSALGTDLLRIDRDVYEKASVSKFAAYIDAALVAGVVALGRNAGGEGVVSLRSPWPFAA